ncbi:aspartate aminotransferase family protein [Nonlabens ponticola]|uniref:Aspartate aminotransferase family protein n=1 Tax=Nonlabens ponticola TaxID=2496866 RepID=A0A3S9MZV7_9FLAO|nr:aspartate aminotransferase family protein [Nonlabens ponticola]AZQ44679.1 aspartate aminotransferase family protein [Nonlabens ponticola]
MKEDFFKYQAPTTPFASGLEISHASGSKIYDKHGKEYIDMVAGVSALPLGHSHHAVVKAIQQQAEKYLHVMVYGEFAQEPAVRLCKMLSNSMPDPLEMTYLVNSGTEAIEASLKLARRITGRSQIVAMHNAYHGNTMGSLSLMDYEERKAPFRPLIPNIKHINYNCLAHINQITTSTAAVIVEAIQGGAGFIKGDKRWFQQLAARCKEVGAMLILDEIQTGVGRTGTFWYFEQMDIVPDMVVSGKGLAGGLPIGALTASTQHMEHFKVAPMLGHITTFGGNPVIAAAACATVQEIISRDLMNAVMDKELRFRESLQSKHIKEIRGTGLMLAIILHDDRFTSQIVDECRERGAIFFLLLFEKRAIRITPAYTVGDEDSTKAINILLEVIHKFYD